MTNLIVGRVLVIGEKSDSRHQHSRSAVTTLQTVFLEESVLQWMQLAVLFESFNRRDRTPVGLNGKRSTRLDRASIHDNRASAAVTRVTTNVRAGESQCFAKEVDQQQTRFDVGAVFDSVDFYFDRDGGHRYAAPFARSNARESARAVKTRTRSRLYSAEPLMSSIG